MLEKILTEHKEMFERRANQLKTASVDIQDNLVEKEIRYVEGVFSMLPPSNQFLQIKYEHLSFLTKYF